MHANCVKRHQSSFQNYPTHPLSSVNNVDTIFFSQLDKVSIVDLYIDIFLIKLPLNNCVHAKALPQNSTKKQFLNFLISDTDTDSSTMSQSHLQSHSGGH